MGKIRVVEYSSIGDSSTSLEYEFEEFADFQQFQKDQREAINKAVQMFRFDSSVEDEPTEDFQSIMEAAVKKKDKLH